MITTALALRPRRPRRAGRLAWTVAFVLLALALPPSGAAGLPQEVPFDVVIGGGRIVDGTGAAWFYGDVGIRGDRIVAVEPRGGLADAAAATRIDASGHAVAPGFIDVQGHSRWAFLFGDGRVISKVTQGITTEIMGEGTTNVPLNERNRRLMGGLPEDPEVAASFAAPDAFDSWLRAMQEHGASPNFGSFVGAHTIRTYGKGMEMGAASEAELEAMRGAVRRAMEDGAFGIASALIYPPGNYASTEELIEICKAMAPYGGIYITHMRSEGDRLLEAIDEAIRIGREAGVAVEIYHLKAAGQRNWHKASEAIARIDAARAEGIDVQANMYPYIAGGTGLAAVFPPWASEGGKLNERLRDPEQFARIKAEVLSADTEWENLAGASGPENIVVNGIQAEQLQRYNGSRLSEIASDLGVHWVDAAARIVESGGAGMVIFMMSEDNVKLQLQQPWIKFGTDAGGVNPAAANGLVHPRTYGTFPRILGKYVREEGVLPLEEAVRKATSAVATRLGIQDRGLIREGMLADVVIFDPATIADRATFEQPHQLSAGVRDVLVNGVLVVRDGAHTGAKPGRIVRGPGWSGR